MILRQGTTAEMLTLWYKLYTSEFFSDNIEKNNAEFWTIDDNGSLIGELYIFKDLDDKDFADGYTTAYLYDFRIAGNMQGKGFGTMLMNRVFERLRELNFKYVTIGVEPEEEANVRLYSKMGFTEKIKTLCEDPCDVDENFMPSKHSEFMLLRKAL
jgi:ribosomal protein S18 acetylase RimI-like enzyme